jgi:type IV secretion system protein VirB8
MTKLKSKNPSEIDKYVSEVRSWETDRVHTEQKSRQLAWRVAGVSLLLACLCVGAVAALVPLKTVEPYVIRVDNSTGVIDVVHALKGGDTTYNEAVNKYFAQLYVRAREGYFREIADVNYRTVGLLSGNTEQQRYFDYFTPKKPQSPLVVYGKYAKVNITVKSTSFIKPNVALVRYVKEVVRGTDRPELSHWASTVTFKFVGAPMSDADRAINPLGYQVIDYRTDPESLTAVEKQAYKPPEPSIAPMPMVADTSTEIPAPLASSPASAASSN